MNGPTLSRGWTLAFVLPNLALSHPIEAAHIALVPASDARLNFIRASSPDAVALLDGFIDMRRRQVQPAALIVSLDGPRQLQDQLEPLIAFRNLVALCVIVREWSGVGSGASPTDPLYSDAFDFYPVSLGENGGLLTDSPAVLGFDLESVPFVGMPHAHLGSPSLGKLHPDNYLLAALIQLWERRFVMTDKNDRYSRVLFRSLETAYQSSTTPFRNNARMNDYGAAIGSWVSACEILAHPQRGH